MRTQFIISLILSTILFSCQNNKEKNSTEASVTSYEVKYAKVFSVDKYDIYTLVTVKNPWDSTLILQKYVLVDKESELPENLPEGTLIRTPIKSAAVYSTIHCAILRELNSLQIIKAVCEPEYIDSEYVKNGVANGSIANLGLASNPDIEKLIMIDPDAIIASPIQGVPYGTIEKTGIPIIEAPDYMEATPLGRAEWIRFYSLFIGKEHEADSIFNKVEKEYNDIKEKVSDTEDRPTVFTDLKYGNAWYIAGGNSFIGNILIDAGASYIWKDDLSTGATPLPFETVLDKAGEAQFWLIKYNQPIEMTYQILEKEYKPYSYFNAFKKRNVYVCHTGKVPYYEDVAIHPEYILKDLAFIFHPDLFSDYSPRYYKRILD